MSMLPNGKVVFVSIEDTSEIAVIDLESLEIIERIENRTRGDQKS